MSVRGGELRVRHGGGEGGSLRGKRSWWGELSMLLQNLTLQVDMADGWLWSLEPSSVYTVRSAYKFLTLQPYVDFMVPVSSLWHNNVPLKVVLFA